MASNRRALQDKFFVEIQMPYLNGHAARRWFVVKDFDDNGEAYRYERAYAKDNPETPVRMKQRRVPVSD